jgi:hypothetical protein
LLLCQLSIFIACNLQFTFDRLIPPHQLMYIQFLLQNISGEYNQVFVCKYCRQSAAGSWNCILEHITESVISIVTKLLAGQWGTVVQFPAEVRDFSLHHCFITDWDLLNYIHFVDKKNQLDVTFCSLYFSSNSCSTCFGQPCAHHQELTTAW